MNARKFFFKQLSIIPILIFPIVLFFPILLKGQALFWGTPALQFIPWHDHIIDLLKDGLFPFWNSLNGMGAPLAANYQSAIFYPANWVAFMTGAWLGTGWLAWTHTLLIMLHLIWAGLGMARLMKTLGYSEMSQVISGLAFSLCGYFVARNGFFSMIWAGSWLPWIVSAASQISFPGSKKINRISPIHYRLMIFMTMQLLAGHAQLTWYTWLLTCAWLLIGGWTAQKWKGIWSVIKQAAIPAALAIGVSAVQLTMTAEYLLLSQRSSSVDFDLSMTYSFWPWRLLGFLAPDIFGNPGLGNYWGYASFWEDAVYIGLIPFILALLTLPEVFRKNKKDAKPENSLSRFLWILFIVSVLFAMGKNTPVFTFLYRFVPTFDMFNSPARYLIWAEFSLAILAGIGFESWRRPQGRALYWIRLATMGGFAITVGAFAGWYLLKDIAPSFVRAAAIAGIFTLAAGFLTLFHPIHLSEKNYLWKTTLIFFIGIDLVLTGRNLLPSVDILFFSSPVQYDEKILQTSGRTYLHPNHEHFIKFKRFLTFSNFSISEDWTNIRYALLPDINVLDGIPSANNFDPLVTDRYHRWMQNLSSLPVGQRQPWYNLMNVTISETRQRDSYLSLQFSSIEGSQRFWVFSCAQGASSEEHAWEMVSNLMGQQEGVFMPETLIVEGDIPESVSCEIPAQTEIEVLRDDSNHLVLDVTSDGDAWLMISESWYPGWKATLNGGQINVYPANYLFKAVQIHQGENRIEMTYMPFSFLFGLGVSALCVFLIMVIIVFYQLQTAKLIHKH